LSTEQLRGREIETAAIDRALGLLAAGDAALVCIVGEPGIGKTSLLRVLEQGARSRQLLVLGGSGAEFERSVPFGPFADALDDHVKALDRRSLEGLGDDDLARLALMLPSLEPRARAASLALGEERHRSFGAVRALLEALAARRPLVLTIDDLHWADGGSLELVSYLVRRPPRAPVLLALAYRPLLLAELVGRAREAFIAGAADELIAPGPLSRSQAAELVADRVEPGRLDALVTECGGNPFYLEQLARASAGDATGAGLQLTGVPRAVSGSLARELERLSDDERAVCQAAAVVGDPFPPELVVAAASAREDVALAAIDTLVRLGIVHQADVPRRFRFRHPIVRRAAYESADPGARLIAHRRVAAALADQGAHPLERAHHVAAATAPGDVAAVALLAEAGRAAARRAPAVGARWYAAALRLMPASTDPAERTRLLVAMATAQGAAGMLEESRRTLVEVLDTLPPELEPLRFQILPFLALVGHMLGRHGDATALLRRALAALPDPSAPEAAELGIETSLDCLYEPDHDAMMHYAGDAERAAHASGEPALEAAGAGVLALAHYSVGEVATALAECDRAVALVSPLPDGELAGRLEGVLSIAWTAMCLERYADCIAIADRGLAISRLTGQGHLLVPLTIARTVVKTWQGELTEATADADDLIDGARLSAVGQSIAWALTLRGWIATLAGELDLAAECGEEACQIARAQARPTYFVTHAVLHLAETRLAQGRAEECLTEIVRAAGGPGLPVCERPLRTRYYEILTRASLACDRLEDARAWAHRARDAVAGSTLGGRLCEAGLAEAAVRLADGEHELAETCALEAARVADAAGDRLLAARARVLAARARAPRSRQGAVELLEQARAEFDSRGAVRSHDEAVRELRRLGRRIRNAGQRGQGDHGSASLSGREREVAELVTDGLTNRDIGARLFISAKTVETHLSAVFRKLDVRSRAAVATALWREDRDGAA
jgi:ATP/maltotriose-dependent transcriptional regulator MalT